MYAFRILTKYFSNDSQNALFIFLFTIEFPLEYFSMTDTSSSAQVLMQLDEISDIMDLCERWNREGKVHISDRVFLHRGPLKSLNSIQCRTFWKVNHEGLFQEISSFSARIYSMQFREDVTPFYKELKIPNSNEKMIKKRASVFSLWAQTLGSTLNILKTSRVWNMEIKNSCPLLSAYNF